MNADKNTKFEVLSPWAEADPIPWRGIYERLEGISGKKIGMLHNSKRTAEPALKAIEKRLKTRFPETQFEWFANLKPNTVAVETELKGEFDKWLDGVDGVISAYGD